ncbi:MAG: cupin domain-containing protein [Chloroflexi bacterium]|nr:cupin domain-containing protein [Chloroflexota bacterium]
MTDERKKPLVFRFKDLEPVFFPRNTIGASDRTWWLCTNKPEDSRWLANGSGGWGWLYLPPGAKTGFLSHSSEHEKGFEVVYQVMEGKATLRTEFEDYVLEKYDSMFAPNDAAHQIINAGTEGAWFWSFWSMGGKKWEADMKGDEAGEKVPVSPEITGPGYYEEFLRIQRARMKRGLPISPGVMLEAKEDEEPQAERPHVTVFRSKEAEPIFWQRDIIGGTDRTYLGGWFPEKSQWFNVPTGGYSVCCQPPGAKESCHTHLEEIEGHFEEIYVVFDGIAKLCTEYEDYTLEKFDSVFMPTNSSHQIRNAGTTDLFWGGVWTSGPERATEYSTWMPAARPGYYEEFLRIQRERKKRGLSISQGADV